MEGQTLKTIKEIEETDGEEMEVESQLSETEVSLLIIVCTKLKNMHQMYFAGIHQVEK